MLYRIFANIRYRLDGWKTIIYNALIAAPSTLYFVYLEFQASGVDITPLLPAKYAAAIIAVIGVVGLVLRIVSNGSVGEKGLPCPPPIFRKKSLDLADVPDLPALPDVDDVKEPM